MSCTLLRRTSCLSLSWLCCQTPTHIWGRCTTTDAKILGESNSDPSMRTDKRRDNWIHQPFVLCTVQRCLADVKFDRPARPERRDRHGGQHSPNMPINPHPTAWRDDERRTHAGRMSIRWVIQWTRTIHAMNTPPNCYRRTDSGTMFSCSPDESGLWRVPFAV